MATGRYSPSKSLWLQKSHRPIEVDPRRWLSYPYFEDILYLLAPNGGEVPKTVEVSWKPFSDFTRYLIDANSEEEADKVQSFIDSVAERIKADDDVPPLIRVDGRPADGTHRAFAARGIKIRTAPTITVVSR